MFIHTLPKQEPTQKNRVQKILTVALIAGMLMPSGFRPFPVLAASAWSPTLLANTEAFQTIDDVDTTANLRLQFGATINKNLTYERTAGRFKFDDDLYIQGDLSVNGSMSGRSLRVYGAMSGNSLFVARAFSGAGLSDCAVVGTSKLLWSSATGRFSCGTDQGGAGGSPEVGTLSFTGGVLRIGDARWVKKAGDTMTGSLIVRVATASTASGALVIAQRTHQTGAFIGSTSNQAPAIAIDIVGTSAAPHLLFGYQGTFDTNLFRKAADILRSDDSLYIQETLSGAHVKADRMLTSSGAFVVEGRSTHNGVTVFNEDSSSASHVRMETDNQANMFFLDATNDRLGLGTATPTSFFDVVGNISGSSLNIQGTSTFNGGLVFGNAAADAITANASTWNFANNTAFIMNSGAGTLEIVGTLSGSNITVSNLRNCDTIDTNANGVFTCGTDATSGGGGGITQADGDLRYVQVGGDTMTGALNIQNGNGGAPATATLLNVRGTMSGRSIVISGTGSSSKPLLYGDTADGSIGLNTNNPMPGSVLTASGVISLYRQNDPSVPQSNFLDIYSKSIAGRMMLKAKGPSGLDYPFQPAIFGNNVAVYYPATATTAGQVTGWTFTSAGTVSHPALASTNLLTSIRRTRWASATTANIAGGIVSATSQCWRGNAAGLGGFFFFARFGQNVNTNGARAFVGLAAQTTSVVTAEPAAALNMVGMGYNAADSSTGNWQLMFNDGTSTATKVDLGSSAARNTTDVYSLYLFAPPNGSTITARVVNESTNTVVLDNYVISTDLPTNTSFLYVNAAGGPAATAVAQNFELNRLYLETDF